MRLHPRIAEYLSILHLLVCPLLVTPTSCLVISPDKRGSKVDHLVAPLQLGHIQKQRDACTHPAVAALQRVRQIEFFYYFFLFCLSPLLPHFPSESFKSCKKNPPINPGINTLVPASTEACLVGKTPAVFVHSQVDTVCPCLYTSWLFLYYFTCKTCVLILC